MEHHEIKSSTTLMSLYIYYYQSSVHNYISANAKFRNHLIHDNIGYSRVTIYTSFRYGHGLLRWNLNLIKHHEN
jgi:hypothetical protein